MADKNKNLASEFHKGYGPNNPHPPGGYYHYSDKPDPDRGLTPHQRKANKKKPLPGGYNLGNKA